MRASSPRTHALLLALALASAGCREAAPQAAKVPQATASGPASPCVYFKDLRPFLPPALAGFELTRDEGSTGKYGEVVVSEAERVFTKPGRSVAIRIVDTTLSGRLGTSIRAAAEDGARLGPEEPTAPIRLEETVGFVRYDPSEEKAEANLLVGGRYVVAVTSLGFESTHEVRRIAQDLDLEGLSKLR